MFFLAFVLLANGVPWFLSLVLGFLIAVSLQLLRPAAK